MSLVSVEALLDSRLVQISDLPERAHLQRLLPRPRLGAVRSPKSIQNNSKTPTMNMAYLLAQLMNKMMRKLTKYMMMLIRRWTHGVGHGGVCFPGGERERRACEAPG